MEAVMWYLAPEEEMVDLSDVGTVAAGTGVSPGEYTGPARVVMHEGEFDKLQLGDVLVCPTTSPVWSVLFPSIGALLTDTGGMLSHPAIIAREYRVPAVVALGNITSRIVDGQVVTVNGTTGNVELQPVERCCQIEQGADRSHHISPRLTWLTPPRRYTLPFPLVKGF
jgi:pyruvate,water dikinase